MLDWLEKIQKALLEEWEYSEQEHSRILNLSYGEQIALGASWPILKLVELNALSWGKVEVILQASKKSQLHDGITEGDLVTLSPSHQSIQFLSGRCISISHKTVSIVIQTDAPPDWLNTADIIVSLKFDDGSFKQYKRGLGRCINMQDHPLLGVLWDGNDPTAENKRPRPFEALDPSQAHAANTALGATHLALIHGPPGTGKTHTICTIVSQLIANGERPLALADSNAAVDNLSRGLIQRGMDPLRLGSRYRIAPDILPYSIGGRVSNHPQQSALNILEREIKRSEGRNRRLLIQEAKSIRKQLRLQLYESAPVITSTLGTMAREITFLKQLTTAIIDEATQALEPAIWSIAPFVNKIILVGDPNQLGPVVLKPNNLLQCSMMQRLIQREPQAATMLSTQRRMNDQLLSLVKEQYGPSYKSHPSVSKQRLEGVLPPLDSNPAIWIDTAGYGADEERDPLSFSLFNVPESKILEQVVNRLIKSGITKDRIGVIAPYSAQVHLLKSLLPEIEVATVNSFQGREKDVILCSFVRSNIDGDLGFVKDIQRLTVATSRAKRLWVGVGDSATLGFSNPFNLLFEEIQEQGGWQSVWEWLES